LYWFTSAADRQRIGALMVAAAQALTDDRQQSIDDNRWFRHDWDAISATRQRMDVVLSVLGLCLGHCSYGVGRETLTTRGRNRRHIARRCQDAARGACSSRGQELDKASCDKYSCESAQPKEESVHQHPALVEALIRDRVAALRQNDRASRRHRQEHRRHRVTEVARRGTGWLLIECGLRLAMPRGAIHRPVARDDR
jgi:hypothetical protein